MAGRMGKKIDTWDVSTDAGRIPVTVYMVKLEHDIKFTAVCEGVAPRYYKAMSDLNALQADVTKTIKQLAAVVGDT